MNILQIDIAKVKDRELTEDFLRDLVQKINAYCKEHENYFLINTTLNLNSQTNNKAIDMFNVFMMKARTKYNHVLFTKEKN